MPALTDPWFLGAVALLVLGVVGSVVPALPGMALSVVAVVGYWWHTGYASPTSAFVAAVVVIGAAALLLDAFAGAVAARAGGASRLATVAAAAGGLVFFLFLGPLGIVVGVALAVFGVELYRGRTAREGARAAAFATAGMLASAAVQLLLTLSVLAGFLIAVLR
ncbi:MAG: DUF456 domain-containing protein [Halobacteriales archaeon]|nr:DUF456 domain-containing protein [Halobacteriales archaeon]